MNIDKTLCPVRTITTFIHLDQNQSEWGQEINQAADFCKSLSAHLTADGFKVQSIRMVTNPLGQYINTASLEEARSDLMKIQQLLSALETGGLRIRFAVGEARTEQEISLLPELIKEFGDICNACVNIEANNLGFIDNEKLQHAASAVKQIADITPQGEGNFNFTVNFNCKPMIPYFPAGYHDNDSKQFVIGLETPSLLVTALEPLDKTVGHQQFFTNAYSTMKQALQNHIDAVLHSIKSHGHGDFELAGIDSSAAPSKETASMVDVYRSLGVEYFGASGTVEASSLLTAVFKSIEGVPLVGFSGLMLAVTEDQGLADATRAQEFDIRPLLTYSAVCGIGLDTVPIPGDTPASRIIALMRDTGTMAFRLNKPLTVRLFPVPGLAAGSITNFQSDDLCNCAVLAVP